MNACCCATASPSDTADPYTFPMLPLNLPFTVLRVALRALDERSEPAVRTRRVVGAF